MSAVSPASDWQKCTRTYLDTLRVLSFPFDTPHETYSPTKVALNCGDSSLVYSNLWCYLKRNIVSSHRSSFDQSSLSLARAEYLPIALYRLSNWHRFKNSRPRTSERQLRNFGSLLNWADTPNNSGRFETLLSDPNVGLQALKGYHTYLRSRLQNHELSHSRAACLDQDAIACMSEIHGRVYKDEIEPLSVRLGVGTKAPSSQKVQTFASTLQAIFDSATTISLSGKYTAEVPVFGRQLRISATDDSKFIELRPTYSTLRLMELACVAFAGLAFADSGANLAVLQQFEEPDDLDEQLAQPDRVSLTQKAVKFRAGSKLIEVHLSATTMTRLKTYLHIRQLLVDALGSDIAPMFIQCSYLRPKSDPAGISPLGRNFLQTLRKRVKAIGVILEDVTFQELRVFKQQDLVRRAPLPVAAKLMGHSVNTAVKAYSKASDGMHRCELSSFLESLQETVLKPNQRAIKGVSLQVTPVGSCAEHGKPSSNKASAILQPNCDKVEGCFFCVNYRIHADKLDLHKLMSCRWVLQKIVPLNGDSLQAYKVYTAICDRINALIEELKRRNPSMHEAVRVDVEENGQLTNYWSRKIQQLYLLNMLPAA